MFYERATKLRERYIDQLQTVSTESEAEAKLQLLSKLMASAFYTSPISLKKHPDELPLNFSVDVSKAKFCLNYTKCLLETVLRDLEYNEFSVTSFHDSETLYIDFR